MRTDGRVWVCEAYILAPGADLHVNTQWPQRNHLAICQLCDNSNWQQLTVEAEVMRLGERCAYYFDFLRV